MFMGQDEDLDRILRKNLTPNTMRNLEKILDALRSGMDMMQWHIAWFWSLGQFTQPMENFWVEFNAVLSGNLREAGETGT